MSQANTGGSSGTKGAQVGPGPTVVNRLVRVGTAGELHGNFTRIEGGQNVNPNDYSPRKQRVLRPGAIILPNLDLDDDPSAARVRWAADQADAVVDAKVNDYDDDQDFTAFAVKEPPSQGGNARRVYLRVDANDAKRIRILRGRPGRSVRDPSVTEIIGPTAGREVQIHSFTGGPPRPPYPYHVESLTLIGDPRASMAPPGGATPPPPGLFRPPQIDTTGGSELSPSVNRSVESDPVLPERLPGDVWVEVMHEQADNTRPTNVRDMVLFTIAPWIMTWNTLPCERIYVAYLDAPSRPGGPLSFAEALSYENHPMVWELQHACTAAGLAAAPPANTSTRLTPSYWGDIHNPNDVPFFLIPSNIHNGDRWVQDEFEIGYCWAPHNWIHIALQSPRGRAGLSYFVTDALAHPRLGVFTAVADAVGARAPGQDYGGNLEVSPPVPVPTPQIAQDRGGPTVKAHRKAPFGKIILGDCEQGSAKGQTSAPLRDFLIAQRVQPVLPVDTSWLQVGHVDEFLSFVPANDRRRYRLLMASVRLMTILLEETLREDAGATMHAGKFRVNYTGTSASWRYDESFVENWVSPMSERRDYSEKVEDRKVKYIRERLKKGLDITEADVLSVPTYWEPPASPANRTKNLGSPSNRTIAENVGMVNMLVVNNYLMIPKPHGPRMPPVNATAVVQRTIDRWFGHGRGPTVANAVVSNEFWARPQESARIIAMYFARLPHATKGYRRVWRQRIIDAINLVPSTTLDPDHESAIRPIERHVAAQLPPGATSSGDFPDWQRITVNDGGVDVIELYMRSILEPIGCTVAFIENFESYHAMSGEVHCGTNAKRSPPELDAGFSARWWDPGVYDAAYDATYDPKA